MNTTLGERIAIARKRAGMSQDELAEAVGLGGGGRSRVSGWETDAAVPDGRFMLKLPEVLGVSADWLLLGKDENVSTLPGEALRELRDWLNDVLPPHDRKVEGNGGNA